VDTLVQLMREPRRLLVASSMRAINTKQGAGSRPFARLR
jgi:hypothetical protein